MSLMLIRCWYDTSALFEALAKCVDTRINNQLKSGWNTMRSGMQSAISLPLVVCIGCCCLWASVCAWGVCAFSQRLFLVFIDPRFLFWVFQTIGTTAHCFRHADIHVEVSGLFALFPFFDQGVVGQKACVGSALTNVTFEVATLTADLMCNSTGQI